jgi:hypothetical protein
MHNNTTLKAVIGFVSAGVIICLLTYIGMSTKELGTTVRETKSEQRLFPICSNISEALVFVTSDEIWQKETSPKTGVSNY